MCLSEIDAQPNIAVPAISVPKITIPEITIPELAPPEVNIPSVNVRKLEDILGQFCNQRALNLSAYPGEDCNRQCVNGEQPKVCHFKFVLENYHAMGPACGDCAKGIEKDCFHPQCIAADGIERGVISINRKIPGPEIHVCKDDLIVVDVANGMGGTATTIHWHGPHQRDTPHMDGVPFVTQCPIEFSTTFRYSYRATEPGTQFYHSHSGHQKVNGHYGALIIREPKEDDPNKDEYDFDLPEHTVLASDWMHNMAEMFMPGLPTRPNGIKPNSLLINGHGRYINPKTGEYTKTPYHVYNVEQGHKYRFRFINSGSHVCPMQLQIEDHKMMIVASDSYNIHPVEIDTLLSNSGERFDIILNTNQPKRDYWMRIRALGSCTGLEIEQFAILSYVTMEPHSPSEPPAYKSPYPEGITLNKPGTNCNFPNPGEYCITNLKAYQVDDVLRTAVPDHKLYLTFNNYRVLPEEVFQEGNDDHFMNIRDNLLLIAGVNNISLTFPPFPLLTQPELIDEKDLCDEGNRPEKCAGKKICQCVHRIKIQLHSIVELVIVDETEVIQDLNHPFHLHGHKFMVVNMGQHPAGIPMTRQIYQSMEKSRSFSPAGQDENPPFKDTVSIPSKGFITIRFRADNPGFWLMHCHFDWHMAVGMGFVLQVGEVSDMVKPPENFPKCGNFLPDINGSVLKR